MAIVNGEPGFTQYTKVNILEEFLIQGDPVATVSADLTDGQIGKWDDTAEQWVYGGVTVDPDTGVWVFDNPIEVPAGSIDIGEVLQLSEGTAELVVVDLLKNQMAFSVNSDFDDATGSAVPTYFDFGGQQTLNINLDDSQTLTDNPLTFSIIGTVVPPDVRLFDQLTLRSGSGMNNFRASLVDNATGVVIRYIPSKAAFEGREPGLDLIAGDNTFFLASNDVDTPGNLHLGFTPILVEAGQQIDFTVIGDTVDLLGNLSGIPYAVAEIHDGPPVTLATFSESFTEGSIPFSDAGGALTQDNANFFWDDTNNRLGIGTNTPSVELDIDGSVLVSGSVHIEGDAIVDGTLTAINTENLNVADANIYLNNGFTELTATTSGIVTNYQATATNTTVSSGAFTAGIPATSNPTVITVGSGTFSQNDLIQISGTNNSQNDGIFEVEDHTGTTLTIRGVGTVATVEDFTQGQFVTSTDNATITKINLAVMRADTNGDWEEGKGSSTPLTFKVLGTNAVGGADTEVQFNNAGEFDGDPNFTWDGSNLNVDGTINGVDVDSSATSIFLTDSNPANLRLNNTAVGINALSSVTSQGDDNTAIGFDAGSNITDSEGNTLIGNNAGGSLIDGINSGFNVVIGSDSLPVGTACKSNVLAGWRTGLIATDLDNSVIIGSLAGDSVGSSSALTLIGDQAGVNITDATEVILLGQGVNSPSPTTSNYMNLGNVMYANLSTNNMRIGGNNSVPSGPSILTLAGSLDVTGGIIDRDGDGNYYFTDAEIPSLSGGDNTAIGDGVLGNTLATADFNVGIGNNALNALTEGRDNVAIGGGALSTLTTGLGNTAIGTDSLGAITTELDNIAIGTVVLPLATGNRNISLGHDSFSLATTVDDNIGIGHGVGVTLTTGDGNILVGSGVDVPTATTSNHLNIGDTIHADMANNNLFVFEAIPSVIGTDNIAIGPGALDAVADAGVNDMVAIGMNAASAVTAPTNPSVIIGANALANATAGTQHVIIGTGAANNGITGGFQSTVVGHAAVQNHTSNLTRSTILGGSTGTTWTSGVDVVLIGQGADVPAAATSDFLNLAGTIFADTDNQFVQVGGTLAKPVGPETLNVQGSTSLDGALVTTGTTDPEGSLTGNPGDIDIRQDGVETQVAVFKASATGLTGWQNFKSHLPDMVYIYDAAQLTALATADIITVTTRITVVIQADISSPVEFVLDGGNLTILTDQHTDADYTYTGGGEFISGNGGFSIHNILLFGSGTGTLINITSGALLLVRNVAFIGWADIGTWGGSNLALDLVRFVAWETGLVIDGCPVNSINSVFLVNSSASGNSLIAYSTNTAAASLNITSCGGTLLSTESLLKIDPSVPLSFSATVSNNSFTGDGDLFKRPDNANIIIDGVANGTNKSVTLDSMAANANGDTTITSAAHGFINGEIITISATTNYNGIFKVFNAMANTFDIATPFVADDGGGNADSEIIELTVPTGHGLTLDEGVRIVGTNYYNGTFVVLDTTATVIDINGIFVADDSGFIENGDISLNETDQEINASGNLGFKDSKTIASYHIEKNGVATTISAADTYQDVDLTGSTGTITAAASGGAGITTITSAAHGLINGQNVKILGTTEYNGMFTIFNVTTNTFDINVTFGATATGSWNSGLLLGSNAERFRIVDEVTGEVEYVGTAPFNGDVSMSVSAFKSGSTETYHFALAVNGSIVEGAPFVERAIVTSLSNMVLLTPVNLVQGDLIKPQVFADGTTNSITVQSVSMIAQ